MVYIDYLTTDGRCWFDTGIIPDFDTKIEVSIMPISWGSVPYENWNGYIGAQNSDDSNSTFQIRNYNHFDEWSARVGNGNGNIEVSYTLGTKYLLSLDKDYFRVDNSLFATRATAMDTCNYTMYIAGINNGESWTNRRACVATFYGVKVWKNNVLMGDFRPAIDDNNNVGFYDEVSETFKLNLGSGTPTAGPVSSSIIATPSKKKFDAEGGNISIAVDCENAWTVSCSANWLTLSSTGTTGDTTIIATASGYSGQTNRDAILTFTDTTTTDEFVVKLTQKKYSLGQPLHLGAAEITDIYLGDGAINAAYLGDVQVYSSGPFIGLKVKPTKISLNQSESSATFTVKSSEAWTITIPEWLTSNISAGTAGTSEVTITIGQMSANASGTVVFNSANYSASAETKYYHYTPMTYVYEDGLTAFNNSHRIDTNVHHTSTAMTIDVEFYGYWTGQWSFSNRIVGYSPEDPECGDDDKDWRLFGFTQGNYDYKNRRTRVGTSWVNGYHNVKLGDNYVLNNENGLTIANGTFVDSVPTPNCPIFVDLSYTKIRSVKIMNGNTVLFDGKAALCNGSYGLFDLVSGTLFTNSDITVVGE